MRRHESSQELKLCELVALVQKLGQPVEGRGDGSIRFTKRGQTHG
jgi:hypothetical protein